MKNIVALLISALLIVTACAACSDKSKQRGDAGTISAESFGADGSDTKDDRLALQDAFNYARDNATADSPATGEKLAMEELVTPALSWYIPDRKV